jgi:hypothetical protein
MKKENFILKINLKLIIYDQFYKRTKKNDFIPIMYCIFSLRFQINRILVCS